MPSLPQSFKSAVLKDANSPLELQDTPLRMPGPGQVLIKVLACGICHSDAFVQAGHLGNPWPRVLGHEVVGDVVAVGDGVKRWKEGDRVGGGWHGGTSLIPPLFCFSFFHPPD
jgi:D-arabinose 1-dehydrogenase-like Zn-dependent alcohol dehydrogenase